MGHLLINHSCDTRVKKVKDSRHRSSIYLVIDVSVEEFAFVKKQLATIQAPWCAPMEQIAQSPSVCIQRPRIYFFNKVREYYLKVNGLGS